MKSLIKAITGIISIMLGTLFVTGSAHAHYLWIELGGTGPAMPPKHGMD